MTQWALWGTIVNTVAVLFGALLGLGIRALSRRFHRAPAKGAGEVPARRSVAQTIQQGLGLCVILIGVSGALGVKYMLVMILSVALGALVGELCDLDGLLSRFGAFVERKLGGKEKGTFAEGFISATLLFCVGAMTVTGALESGLLHTHNTYYAKGLIDMVCAVTFAYALGAGVTLSAVGVFAVQGTLVLIAVLAGGVIPMTVTGEMIAVGSLLVVAIGTNLLGVTRIKVMNLVPAMLFPIALCPLYELIFA